MRDWARQPNEPPLWFERFERYRLAGPARSLLKLYNEEREKAGKSWIKSAPASWAEAAKTWQWEARAAAWDDQELAKEALLREEELRKEREQARQTRRTLLKVAQSRLAKRLAEPDVADLKPEGAFHALRIVLHESRAEYDDEPVQRVRNEPVPPVPWELIPDEMQVAFVDGEIGLREVLAYVARQRQPGT
jgi:hypothetical protein